MKKEPKKTLRLDLIRSVDEYTLRRYSTTQLEKVKRIIQSALDSSEKGK